MLNRCRTGNAVKNRWNWMATFKRGDARDTIVRRNCHLFCRILQAPSHSVKKIMDFYSCLLWISIDV